MLHVIPTTWRRITIIVQISKNVRSSQQCQNVCERMLVI